jgi:hypothetical protein
VKRTRSILCIAVLVLASSATLVSATPISTDDPERCGERGATVHRTVGAVTSPATSPRIASPVAPARSASTATPTPAVARKPAPLAVRKTPAPKPARTVPNANTPAPPTPGMGILLKMANGASGGEVTWSPSKPADNSTGASWIL